MANDSCLSKLCSDYCVSRIYQWVWLWTSPKLVATFEIFAWIQARKGTDHIDGHWEVKMDIYNYDIGTLPQCTYLMTE